MRQKKIDIRIWSPWTYLGAAMEAEIARANTPPLKADQLVVVMTIGIEPATLAVAKERKEARALDRIFQSMLREHPALTVQLLALVSAKWNVQTIEGRIQKFIATHPVIGITNRKGTKKEIEQCGEIMQTLAQDQDIARAIDRDKIFPGTKSFPADAVKKARQKMSLPKEMNLNISPDLGAALNHLLSLGFCKHW